MIMRFFDLHCDTVYEAANRSRSVYDNDLEISVKKAAKIDDWRECYAAYIVDGLHGEAAYGEYKRLRDYFYKQKETVAARLKCNEKGRYVADGANKTIDAILTVENATALGGRLERVFSLAKDGVRMMGLTWNAENELAYGAGSVGGGLKPFGISVISEMRKYGIAVDVSHLCDESLNDLLRRFDFPVAASHSNLRSVCGNKRNLTDDQFREIASRGGVVGINLHAPFISESDATLYELLCHVDRMLSLGGESCVAFGSDFDGGKPPEFCRDISYIPWLYDSFTSRFGEEQTDKIFFENAYVFFDKQRRN